jgi:hypothetical protein
MPVLSVRDRRVGFLVTMARREVQELVRMAQEAPDLGRRPWEQVPAHIAAVLRPYVPRARDAIIQGIRAEIPEYARPLEGSFGVGVRTGVEQALQEFLALVEDASHDRTRGHDVYVALGRGEVREGRSLEVLLTAYRVGARIAWRQIAEGARAEGIDSDSLALLAESLFAYIDEVSAYSAEGYAQERALTAAESDRVRRRLVRLLVDPRPADVAAVEAAARQAGWELPPSLAALVWRDGPARVASRLPDGAIVAPVEELRCALIPDPVAPTRVQQIRAALGDHPAALGPPVPWVQAAVSAEHAFAAHRLLEAGVIPNLGTIAAEDHLAELILHRDESLAAALREHALAPLGPETRRSRERLTETLAAWLDHQGAIPATAAALHVHPHTVRYRLGRLRELFGERLDDPRRRFELALALRSQPARD